MIFFFQVLEVVRNNYDTLTLKLYDNLDQFERYTEKPIETAFFTPLVRNFPTFIFSVSYLPNLLTVIEKEKALYAEFKAKQQDVLEQTF